MAKKKNKSPKVERKPKVSSEKEKEVDANPKGINKQFYLIATVVVILIVALIRLRLLDVPLERDEGEYAYMGSLILEGIVPYKEAYNMKLPGVSFMYAIIMMIFGQTTVGIHIGLLLINAVTGWLFFISFKKLFNNNVAFVAAAAYVLLSVSPAMLGFAAHATQFVSFFVALGLWLFTAYRDSPKVWLPLLIGVSFGMAFLMKQQAVFFILMAGVMLFTVLRDKKEKLLVPAALYAIGVFIPYLITIAFVSGAGAWNTFWFWTYEYASKYASGASFESGKELFALSFGPMFKEYFLLWLLFFAGGIMLFVGKLTKQQKVFAISLAVFSLLSICPGFYFRKHYFITLLPGAILLMGICADYISNRLNVSKQLVPILIVGISLIFAVMTNSWYYIDEEPEQISKRVYGTNPFTEAVEIADYIKEHSNKDDKVAVVGSEPEIYFYSDRRAATGYLYTYPLMELHDYNKKMQQEMIGEITEEQPEYLVFCKVDASWLARPESPKDILGWFFGYTKENYDLVGAADIKYEVPTQFFWGEAAATYQPQSDQFILVFQKRS